MDPLSITVSVVTLLQATNAIVLLCYNYASAAKGAARTIGGVIDEMKTLRSVLESLEQLLRSDQDTEPSDTISLTTITALCNQEDGPIAKELKILEEKLRPPGWASQDGSRRKALMQFLTWPLKEGETTKTLQNIERLKSTLELALTVDNTSMIKAIRQTQESLDQSLKSLHKDERYWKILQWLSAPDPSINFHAALKHRHAETGLWLLDSRHFQDWKVAPGSFFWLHGTPGCGKTVLSATVIENLLQEGPNIAAGYYYFDFNDAAKQDHKKMLRSLVLQLFPMHGSIPEPLASLFKSCQDGAKPPQTQDLETLFKALIESSEKTFIVLDALDECEDREELLDFLETALAWASEKLNVLVTSRKLKEFDDFFGDHLQEKNRLSIQSRRVDEDICSYVHGKLHQDRRFRRWQRHPKVQEEIQTRLMEKCDGMFRWAACQLDLLSDCRNVGKLREALNTLPMTLDETYDRILSNIEPLYRPEVLHILQWLTCSLRPLSLEEVAEIVAFDSNNDSQFNSENRFAEPEEVLTLCSSLVISIDTNVDDDKESSEEGSIVETFALKPRVTVVRLAHLSVKEYLVSSRIRTGSAAFFSIDEKESNAVIGDTSLSCLHLYDEASFADTEDMSKDFPLTRYAAEYWRNHLLKNDGNVPPMAIQLFLSEKKLRYWIALFDIDSRKIYSIGASDIHRVGVPPESAGSQLYYAVLTGLTDLVEALMKFQGVKSRGVGVANDDSTADLDTDDRLAALQIKSRNAYVNVTGGRLYTPLQAASWLGNLDVVGLLLKYGADPNLYGGSSALSAAAHNGHLIIMKLLLDTGADIHEGLALRTSGNLMEGDLGKDDAKEVSEHAFGVIQQDSDQEWITLSQRRKYLARLEEDYKDEIKPPVDMLDRHALEQSRKTALFEAADSGNFDIVNFMLDHRAMIDLRIGEHGDTALIRASRHRDEGIVQLLLEKGASVDKTNMMGFTALMIACMWQHENIAHILLSKGAHDICTGAYRGTCMMTAIGQKNDRIVKLLLENGADVSMSADTGGPMRAAVVEGHEPTALRRGHVDIAKLLVAKKADVNAVEGFDAEDGIPFWAYAMPTTRDLARRILSLSGISKLSFRPKKRTQCARGTYIWEDSPLWVAAALGDEESVKLLLDHGANPNTPGPYALTPSDIATMEEHEVVVQLLLAAGGITHPRVEDLKDREVERLAKTDRSSLQLEDALEAEPTASQEALQDALSEKITDRGSNIQAENPVEARPPNSSVAMDLTAQHEPRSSSPDSYPYRVPTFRGPPMMLMSAAGGRKELNQFEVLSKAKVKAKANGVKRFGKLSDYAERWMHSSEVMDLYLMAPSGVPSAWCYEGSMDEEEEEEGWEKGDKERHNDEQDNDGKEDNKRGSKGMM